MQLLIPLLKAAVDVAAWRPEDARAVVDHRHSRRTLGGLHRETGGSHLRQGDAGCEAKKTDLIYSLVYFSLLPRLFFKSIKGRLHESLVRLPLRRDRPPFSLN